MVAAKTKATETKVNAIPTDVEIPESWKAPEISELEYTQTVEDIQNLVDAVGSSDRELGKLYAKVRETKAYKTHGGCKSYGAWLKETFGVTKSGAEEKANASLVKDELESAGIEINGVKPESLPTRAAAKLYQPLKNGELTEVLKEVAVQASEMSAQATVDNWNKTQVKAIPAKAIDKALKFHKEAQEMPEDLTPIATGEFVKFDFRESLPRGEGIAVREVKALKSFSGRVAKINGSRGDGWYDVEFCTGHNTTSGHDEQEKLAPVHRAELTLNPEGERFSSVKVGQGTLEDNWENLKAWYGDIGAALHSQSYQPEGLESAANLAVKNDQLSLDNSWLKAQNEDLKGEVADLKVKILELEARLEVSTQAPETVKEEKIDDWVSEEVKIKLAPDFKAKPLVEGEQVVMQEQEGLAVVGDVLTIEAIPLKPCGDDAIDKCRVSFKPKGDKRKSREAYISLSQVQRPVEVSDDGLQVWLESTQTVDAMKEVLSQVGLNRVKATLAGKTIQAKTRKVLSGLYKQAIN